MASCNAWNGTPMAVNPILRSIVIDKWGADVVSSDGGAVTLLVDPRHLFPNQEAAVVACLKAGINQYLDKYKDQIHQALADGSVTPSDLDNALRRKYRIEMKLGLLDPPDMVPYTKRSKIFAGLGRVCASPWHSPQRFKPHCHRETEGGTEAPHLQDEIRSRRMIRRRRWS